MSRSVNMSKSIALLPLCVVLLGASQTSAQVRRPVLSDQKYCNALSEEYDRYVVNTTHTVRADAEGGYAKAACKQHHPSAGIPILELKLADAKVPLPYASAAEIR